VITGKFNTVLEYHPDILEKLVSPFIWTELEVRCRLVK
jgi:hypothetical protein|tara:strand:+ start:67 stop:180 length:114 start_codon:yes stop_codon:yes gene_type:complete